MTRTNGMNSDLESAIQNVLCSAELAAGPMEDVLTGETACYAFYKLLEEIEALRHAADAQYAHRVAAMAAATPDWTRSRHG